MLVCMYKCHDLCGFVSFVDYKPHEKIIVDQVQPQMCFNQAAVRIYASVTECFASCLCVCVWCQISLNVRMAGAMHTNLLKQNLTHWSYSSMYTEKTAIIWPPDQASRKQILQTLYLTDKIYLSYLVLSVF